MSQLKARSALMARVTLAPAILPANKLFYENVKGDEPENGVWAVVQFVQNPPTPKTLGALGYDRCIGQVVIGVSYPLGKGTKDADSTLTALAARFVAGKELTYQGQVVKVLSAGAGTPYKTGNCHRTPFVINWQADIKRTAV